MLQKIHSFFFQELQLITVLLLICNSYTGWSTRSISLKLCEGFSIFHSVSFLLEFFIFVQQKSRTLWLQNVIIPFKIKIIEKPHTVLLPDPWFLSWNNKFEKFTDICMSWSSRKTDLKTNFLNLENRSFQCVTFSQ